MAEASRKALPRGLQDLDFRRVGARTLTLLTLLGGPVLVAVCALIAALHYVNVQDVTRPAYDDSYISLQFARNLAETGKLTFDGESWSTGATSTLHVVLMALIIKLGAAPIGTSIAVGVASHMVLAVAVYALAWSIFRTRLAAILAGLAISFTALAALDAGAGLETPLFMALLSGAMAAFFVARSPRGMAFAGLLIALAVLTRPEGGFLLPAVVIYRWLDRSRTEPLAYFVRDAALLALPGVIAFGGLALLSLSINGSIGGTAMAKMRFFQESKGPFAVKLSAALDNFGFFLSYVMPFVLVGSLVVRRRETLLFVLFWLPVLIFYTFLLPGGLNHYFYRYQHPVLPLIAVLAGGGAAYLFHLAVTNNTTTKALVIAGLVIAVVPVWHQYDRWRDIYKQATTETYQDLEAMALDLNTIIRPDETLATHDIGAVGYFGNYRVLDLVGLVNPDVVPYHEDYRVGEYIQLVRPDYLMFFPDWDYIFLRINPGADPEHFELVKVYESGPLRASPYVLYRITYDDELREDIFPPPPAAP